MCQSSYYSTGLRQVDSAFKLQSAERLCLFLVVRLGKPRSNSFFCCNSGRRGCAEHVAIEIIVAVVSPQDHPPSSSLFWERDKPLLPWLAARIGALWHLYEFAIRTLERSSQATVKTYI